MDVPSEGAAERPAYRTPAAVNASKAELAIGIALFALLMWAVAFLSGFSVVGGYDFANKFENGEWPPGTDVGAMQLAARISIGAAVIAAISLVTAAATRTNAAVAALAVVTGVAGLVYLPIGLLILGVAF
jgi:hypothetical protein